MEKDTIKARIEYLVKILNQYGYEYYVLDNPTVSDAEYDSLIKELERLENEYPDLVLPNSPTKNVGAYLKLDLDEIVHEVPMMSLANAFSYEEMYEFDERIKKALNTVSNIAYTCELKIDGIASTAHYETGLLVLGATRGNGVVGENITANDKVQSVIWAPGAGQNGFDAIGKILKGEINPSGRTTDTFMVDFTKDPAYQNFSNNNKTK